ncbi:MAG: HAMP domain-containing histidine kinase [Prevotella sp.]|nr:HAMP domain-containing histidine kinase [Alistipes senegalensis]MCM1356958.1 HAMP domain-containing histidine kinase [Prevotella sp.]MCM1472440.1 HAMP domain-containing histidine kinase [Muribaculaceae bacterium]
MFRQAQLKLFAVITSILLAIFIAVLSSINIVTSSFMQRQSKEVLQKIASGIEYDEKTDTFSFTPPENYDRKHNQIPPPEKTTTETTTTTTTETTTGTETTTETTTVEELITTTEEVMEETTTEETTSAPEETLPEEFETEENLPPEIIPEPQAEPEPEEEIYEETSVEIPEETETPTVPAENIPPTENRNENDIPPDFPPDNERRPEDFPREDNHRNPDRWWHSDGWKFYNPEEENIFRQSYNESNNIIQLENIVTCPPEKKHPDNMLNDSKKEPVPKSFGSVDFFVIMADNDGNYLACMNNDDLTDENAQEYINNILNRKDITGMINSYQFYNVGKNNGTLIALTDKSEEKKVMNQFIRTTIIIGAITLIVLSFAGYFLSKKSIEPIKTAFEKQKQFISDASHELKTPLTVISANADVLSDEIGENKWLNYIKSQTERMNLLVNDLLNLTRLENNTSDFICSEFNLSQAVTNTALPFECRAFETNKKFIVNVEDGLTVTGSEKHIKQMTAIFIDNALKYSNDGGIVRVTLKKQGDKKILSVYNTGTGVKDSEKDKIFERFYRTDDSRTRQATGGYGLGLAIAKSIIDKHKFKVNVENEEGKSISFVVTM